MTHMDTHHTRHVPPPPLTPTLPPAAFNATPELAQAIAAMHFTVDSPPLLLLQDAHARSPARRRARSLSPQRRSPKLRHTNGRLHVDPLAVDGGENDDDSDGRGRASDGDDDHTDAIDDLPCHLLSEEELLRVIQQQTHIQTQTHDSHSPVLSARTLRQRCESHSFPPRKDVRRSISCVTGGDACTHSVAELETESVATAMHSKRTPTPRRIKIFYRDEALRESCAKNTRRMIEHARLARPPTSSSPSSSSPPPLNAEQPHSSTSAATTTSPPVASNQQRLAYKALRYRKLLDRMHEIDDARLNDPSFDVLECLGVQWCKV